MKSRPLWKLAISIPPEAEEAVTELLESQLSCPASAYHNLRTGAAEVAVYLQRKPDLKRIEAHLAADLRRLEMKLNFAAGKISLKRLPAQDWAESWKRHFKPMEIHSRLLLRPSWSKRKPKRGQLLVELDPGLSFGTGQHPTTAYCLREIIRAQQPGKAQSLLDLGTGSGVLAIAAARLGYTPIHACDFDTDAVRIARSNAKRNDVPLRINFSHADVTRLTTRPKTKFSVVCANLISTLLVEQTRRILCQLAPGGILILAGILKSEFKIVSNAYEKAGLTLRRSHVSGEWRSGTWVWKKI